jgi:hypothetical protein
MIEIKVDSKPVQDAAKRLGSLTAEQIGELTVQVINDTANDAYDLARTRMLRSINLTDAYVQQRMKVDEATTQKPTATITAFGGKGFTTSLSHYGSMQETKPVNWSNSRIQAMGKKFGKWPGWTERTGSPGVGIAPNLKADGKSVEVTRGSRKRMGSNFSLAGKKDSSGNLLIFSRNQAGAIRALMGPSVYQLFRVASADIENQVTDDFEKALSDMADEALKKAMA